MTGRSRSPSASRRKTRQGAGAGWIHPCKWVVASLEQQLEVRPIAVKWVAATTSPAFAVMYVLTAYPE